MFVEPFKDGDANNGLGVLVDDDMLCVDSESDPEHDSEDSNREDADQNDYPDEESDEQISSDEEAAIRRYNKKA